MVTNLGEEICEYDTRDKLSAAFELEILMHYECRFKKPNALQADCQELVLDSLA